MNLTAEINQATAGMTISLGWMITIIGTALGSILLIIFKLVLDRYIRYLDKKEEKADKRNEEVTSRLDSLNKNFSEMAIHQNYMLKQMNDTGAKLEVTVKRVDELEKMQTGILKELKKG